MRALCYWRELGNGWSMQDARLRLLFLGCFGRFMLLCAEVPPVTLEETGGGVEEGATGRRVVHVIIVFRAGFALSPLLLTWRACEILRCGGCWK